MRLKFNWLGGVVLPSLLFISPVAKADVVVIPGPALLETCNDRDPIKHSACVGFIAGVTNSYLNSGQTCVPANTDPKQVTDFVRDYMNRNNHLVNQPAVNIVLLALKARYPCIGNSGPRIARGPGFALQFNFPSFRGF